MDLDALLQRVVATGASDVHLKLGQPPIIRIDGDLEPLPDWPVLGDADLEGALHAVTVRSPKRREAFYESGDLDIALHPELPRLRVNGFRQRGAISVAFRVIPSEIPSFEDLHLPEGVRRLAKEHRGLVLVTGPTGSGKTTSLACMLDHINRTRRQHIVTIEDPIEILHPTAAASSTSARWGSTRSASTRRSGVLRRDPDIILIGELRDTETAHTALQAAESGHLVFSTLHTLDAAETLGRMIEFFPPAKQQQIRSILAGSLRGVSQRPLPRAGGAERRPSR